MGLYSLKMNIAREDYNMVSLNNYSTPSIHPIQVLVPIYNKPSCYFTDYSILFQVDSGNHEYRCAISSLFHKHNHSFEV